MAARAPKRRRREAPLPASAVARWRVTKRLTKSGQSTAFIVESVTDQRQGVLKVQDVRANQRERISREVQVIQSIRHPAVTTILDSDLESDRIWLVTPLGTPFPRWWKLSMAQKSPTDRALAARRVVLALIDGLTAVHSRGVVHRDIKPDNVVVVDDQPTLIDFGIAYVPGAGRLTLVDGRPVANTFAAPAEAYYGQIDEPKPWWDCLGLSWLWAWMLTAGSLPKGDRFHWRYHRMIETNDGEGVRALLAVCSDEVTAPSDAPALARLVRTLGLCDDAEVSSPVSPRIFADASAVHAAEQRAAIVTSQTRREQVQAAAEVLTPLYERTRDRLKEVVEAARREGRLPIDLSPYANELPIRAELLKLQAGQKIVELFACIGTPARMQAFRIALTCTYFTLGAGWPFRFELKINPGKYADTAIMHLTDGSPLLDGGRAVDHSFFPDLLAKWLGTTGRWRSELW